MRVYYDLHIHSALSPCGDSENTPNNIVNMAMLKELDVIALTDHNSMKNCPAVKKLAEELGILFIFGMELTTSEEIHMLCLFENQVDCENFSSIVEERRMRVENKVSVFGEQLILDENDQTIGFENDLLILSSGIDIYEAVKLVEANNGVSVLAHIDRNSYSIITVLGEIPDDLDVKTIELSANAPKDYLEKHQIDLSKYNVIHDSDAHYLGDISEKVNFLEVEEKSVKCILDAISRLK